MDTTKQREKWFRLSGNIIATTIEPDWPSKTVARVPEGPNADEYLDLIAEAGTVHHETGLTPRQLADQRAELREALEGILVITDRDHVAWDKARAALANSRT